LDVRDALRSSSARKENNPIFFTNPHQGTDLSILLWSAGYGEWED
jgi:hypothetical protein